MNDLIVTFDLGTMQLTKVEPLLDSEDCPVLHLTEHIPNPTVNTQVSPANLQLTASLAHLRKSSHALLAQSQLDSPLSCFVARFSCEHNYVVTLEGGMRRFSEATQDDCKKSVCLLWLFSSASHCIRVCDWNCDAANLWNCIIDSASWMKRSRKPSNLVVQSV